MARSPLLPIPLALLLMLATANHALARQAPPTLSLSGDITTPGSIVTATITGQPGQHYALLGSTMGAGYSFAGVNLALGADVVIIASGCSTAREQPSSRACRRSSSRRSTATTCRP